MLTAVLIIPLLFVAADGGQLVNLGSADPYVPGGTRPPPQDTQPPTITLSSPQNNTALAIKDIILSFTVNVGESTTPYATKISSLRYRADWQQNDTTAYADESPNYPIPARELEFSFNLKTIPEGSHSIVIYATETGLYNVRYTIYDFAISNSWTVNFAIDTSSPHITILSPQNLDYAASSVPLEFAVNEPISKVMYSLDWQVNVTVAGNVTLSGLSDGEHTMKVYAWDEAGNVGVSETFTVEPFPMTLVAVVASAAAVSFGLVAIFLRRKRKAGGS